MPQDIPRIIHCIWLGGGDITTVKSLDGIHSWLKTQPDYEVWIWWDDSHLFSVHGTRAAVKNATMRAYYETTLDARAQKSALGRDVRNLRTLASLLDKPLVALEPEGFQEFRKAFEEYCAGTESLHGGDRKLALSLFLIARSQRAMEPLRTLAADAKREGRTVKLCNVRDHEFLPGAAGSRMAWRNRDLYDAELAFRGIFPAAASDILRYEVLYNFGGIYMDVDLELTKPLRQLSVENGLALCAYEDAKGPPRRRQAKKFQQDTQLSHGGQCLYAMNNIVATHPGSDFAEALRTAIAEAYAAMRVESGGRGAMVADSDGAVLRRYWETVVNKSTIDLTGPNLVREVQFGFFRGLPPHAIPSTAVKRLALALRAHANLLDAADQDLDVAPQLEVEAFPRFSKVWRDDDPAHEPYFQWAFEHTYFPMENVNWKTDAAKNSDTKQAAK